MEVTPSKILALVVAVASLLASSYFSPASGPGAINSLPILMIVAALGLSLIWFPETLADTGLVRGVYARSPAGLVAAFGWLFLLGYPVLVWFLTR